MKIVDPRFARLSFDKRFRLRSKIRRKLPRSRQYQQLLRPQMQRDGKGSMKVGDDQTFVEQTYGGSNSELREWMQEYDEESEQAQQFVEDYLPRQDNQQVVQISQATTRMAVQNYDWKNITLSDIYNLANSFKGPSGSVLSVARHLSRFGKERLEHQEVHGPKWDYPGLSQQDALRAYQRDRLSYYYAVIKCSNKQTAQSIYSQCNGLQFQKTHVIIDLRYVPEGLQLPFQVEVITQANSGSTKDFMSRAAGHSKVQLTWDQQDVKRKKVLTQNWNKTDLNSVNWKEYVDLSDSEQLGLQSQKQQIQEDSRFGSKSWGNKQKLTIKFTAGLQSAAVSLPHQAKPSFKERKRQNLKAARERKMASRGELELLISKEGAEEFAPNLQDKRFKSLYEDARFLIDPNDNAFDPKRSGLTFQKQLKERPKKT